MRATRDIDRWLTPTPDDVAADSGAGTDLKEDPWSAVVVDVVVEITHVRAGDIAPEPWAGVAVDLVVVERQIRERDEFDATAAPVLGIEAALIVVVNRITLDQRIRVHVAIDPDAA